MQETFVMKVGLFLEFILLVLTTSRLGILLLCYVTIFLKVILKLTGNSQKLFDKIIFLNHIVGVIVFNLQ